MDPRRAFGRLALLAASLSSGCGAPLGPVARAADPTPPLAWSAADGHVHLLSPTLVRDWKSLGVPFSKPDEAYGSADALLAGADGLASVVLVSMGHVYDTPWFEELGLDEEARRARVRGENDWVAAQAARHAGRAEARFSVPALRPWAGAELERCLARLPDGVRGGLKLHLASSGVDLREDADVDAVAALLAAAEAARIPVLLHLDTQRRGTEAEHVRRFLERAVAPCPELALVIAHLGGSGGYGAWTRSVFTTCLDWLADEARAGRPRRGVRFDVSAVVLEEASEGVPPTTADELERLRRDLLRTGAERVGFASDYPVFHPRDVRRVWREVVGFPVRDG